MRIFLLLFILCLGVSSAYARQSCDWPFRTATTLTEQSGSDLGDYQVKISISSSDFHDSYRWTLDGFDLRVFDSDDVTPLEFWIEDWDQANELAEVWVRFPVSAPLLANQSRTIYFYYGNENASPLATVPFTFVEPGIKFHTRPTSLNPTNKTAAFNEFNSIADNGDNTDGYGCTFITNFTGITKRATFGAGDNFAAYSESYFQVGPGEAGAWSFRYGADFGRGGALYVDDVALEEDWNNDLWWNNSWSNPDVLQGSITLSEGYHKLEVIGFEGCCDGGITVQFRKPGGNWTTFTVNDIDIRSRACPVAEPSIVFYGHDVCDLVDLRIRGGGSLSIPSNWEVGVPGDVSFQMRNTGQGTDATSNPAEATIQLPTGFNLTNYVGSNWSCLQAADIVTCQYSAPINRNQNSTALSLTLLPTESTSPGNGQILISVSNDFYDVNPSNNQVTQAVTIVDLNALIAVQPVCMSPAAGIWARYFDIETYGDSTLDDAAAMQAIVDDRVNQTYVDGQTIISSINGTANPFDDRSDEYYLTVLQGYLNIPETGDYEFALDGDDALEFWIDDQIITTFYGLHGASGSAQNWQSVRLAAGYHKFEYRMQEYTGSALYQLFWDTPFSNDQLVPSAYFYHCAGKMNITMTHSVVVNNDPVNGANLPKAIPGAQVLKTVDLVNEGKLSTDVGSFTLVQSITSDLAMNVNDWSGMGPILIQQGSGLEKSGVGFTFTTLADTADGLAFSNDGGVSFNYTPVADADGFDANVTDFRLTFSGHFLPSITTQPKLQYQYLVRIE